MSHHPDQRPALAAITLGCLFVLAFALPSYGKKADIVGEVLDGFGKPLKDAVVSVEFTTFKSTTDEQGKYSVGYVPGKFKVLFTKEGYASVTLELNVAIETTFPAASVTLYKIPASQGIWFFGEADYVPLKRGELSVKSREFPFSWDKPTFKETYTATALGEFTLMRRSARLRFLDNDPTPMVLLKLGDGFVVFSRTKYGMGLKTEDSFQQVQENTTEIAAGLTLREVSLDEGKYAYVRLGEGAQLGLHVGRPIAEPSIRSAAAAGLGFLNRST